MTLELDEPTGLPSWPVLLLAGREGTGKSFGAALASASPMVDGAIWVNYGEKRPDEYGAVPGANFKIARHNGTYTDVLRVVTEIAALPVGEKPRLLIFDSGTRLWEIIGDNLQLIANQRAAANARRQNRTAPTGDATITTELWNKGKKDWNRVMLALKAHRGPVIITARLDNVSVMDDRGQPTAEKQWKAQAHKSLVYDVNAIVEMPERGTYIVKKVQSVLYELPEPTTWPDFTVEDLWKRLGLEQGAGDRTYDESTTEEDEAMDEPAEVERDWVADARKLDSWTATNRLIAAASSARVSAVVLKEMRAARDRFDRDTVAGA